jgi:hypothetical protein
MTPSGNALLEAPKIHESFVGASMRELLRHSKLLVNLYSRFLIFKNASLSFVHHPFFFIPEPPPQPVTDKDVQENERERWEIKEKIVRALVQQTNADHAPLLLAAFAGREEPTTTITEISRHMEELAPRIGFAYENLVPYVFAQEDATGKQATFLPCDGHWSSDGHRFVAEALYEYLRVHPTLVSHH